MAALKSRNPLKQPALRAVVSGAAAENRRRSFILLFYRTGKNAGCQLKLRRFTPSHKRLKLDFWGVGEVGVALCPKIAYGGTQGANEGGQAVRSATGTKSTPNFSAWSLAVCKPVLR